MLIWVQTLRSAIFHGLLVRLQPHSPSGGWGIWHQYAVERPCPSHAWQRLEWLCSLPADASHIVVLAAVVLWAPDRAVSTGSLGDLTTAMSELHKMGRL